MRLDRLPCPTEHGAFWFGAPGSDCPAIIPISGTWPHRYFVSTGERVLFDKDNQLLAFEWPLTALARLREEIGR